MNAERLLAHYHRVADVPDAVPRLRRFILDLAVRGKLVEQDPNDEPASELLKRIAEEKIRLMKAGEIKQQKPMPPVSEDELSIELPTGWAAARLADMAVCLDHKRKPINSAERKKRIEGKTPDQLYPYFGATQQQGWIDGYLFDEELVLLGEDGVPFFDALRRKSYLVSGKTWVNNHAHVFKGILVSHAFLTHYLNTFDYTARVVGATRTKLNQSRAVDIPVPLPPLAEQRRIVSKVHELMALCDRLEAARTDRETQRDRLAAASLARLNAPDPYPTTFRRHAAFVFDNLVEFTTRHDQIKAVRQTILNLAVRGKLVEQDTADGPVTGDVATSMVRNPTEKKAKPKKNLPLSISGYNVPQGWSITELRSVCTSITDGDHLPPPKTRNGIPFLVIGDVRSQTINFAASRFVSPKYYEALDSIRRPRIGDLLYTLVGSYGIPVVVREDQPFCVQRHIGILRPSALMDVGFLAYSMESDVVFSQAAACATGTAQKTVPLFGLRRLLIPVPPLAEQQRIAAKVVEAMSVCNRLEATLDAGNTIGRDLLDGLLNEALGEIQ